MADVKAPTPGSPQMPPWDLGVLPDAPEWRRKNWAQMIGPGLLCAGAAIGGGEWLMGPVNTGRYGGAVLWVCTLSIFAQVIYNIEISRYTLFTGEPIMNGKFRTFLGPMFWLGIYLILDFGSLMPYQVASTATPVYMVATRQAPGSDPATRDLLIWIACGLYIVASLPLVFAGKIYSFIKGVMTVKVIVVFSTLAFLALFYSTPATWADILTGFFKFGTVPAQSGQAENIFVSLLSGRGFPRMDPAAFAALAAFAAIAGIGGIKNVMISSYTRDQGWGMGAQVGAIPSILGKHNLQLSHVGKVFEVNDVSLPRWKRWIRHVTREQVFVWGTGALIGVGLPAMLSVQFVPRGTKEEGWGMATLTAQKVQEVVGGPLGVFYGYLLLICGILVLLPNTITDADATVRRWVDLAWTGSKRLQKWDPRKINLFYFWVLVAFVGAGVVILRVLPQPKDLIQIYGCIANFALGYSCFHVLAVNLTLLPPPVRPGFFNRTALSLSGLYFLALAGITLYFEIQKGNRVLGYSFAALMVVLMAVLGAYAGWLARRGGERPGAAAA
jgi:hypothetical protein